VNTATRFRAGAPRRAPPTGTLSERAKQSFEAVAREALRQGLCPEGESVSIEPVQTLPKKMAEKKVVLLSIATQTFRLVLGLLVRFDAETKAHFARLNRVEDLDDWAEQAFQDAVAECGNIIVGAMNRELGRYFPNVGMSTPNVLDRDALAYLDALSPGHTRWLRVDGLPLSFHAVLFVTPSAAVDFHAELERPADAVDSGELEMF
jgi:hypothetical protein